MVHPVLHAGKLQLFCSFYNFFLCAVIPVHTVVLPVLHAGKLQLLFLRGSPAGCGHWFQDSAHHLTVRHTQWQTGMLLYLS